MAKQDRDMTKAQFDAACKRHGFKHGGFMGYYDLGVDGTSVSIFNAGTRRRNQLAYLLREHGRAERRQAAQLAGSTTTRTLAKRISEIVNERGSKQREMSDEDNESKKQEALG